MKDWTSRIAIAVAIVGMLTPTLAIAVTQTAQALPSDTVAQTPRSEQDLTVDEIDSIHQAVISAIQRPGLPELQIRGLVMEGPWGLVTYTMGESGGTLALWKEEYWEVYGLGGGAPRAEDINQQTDIPVSVAQRLLDRLDRRQ
jgi:hypothetical protein